MTLHNIFGNVPTDILHMRVSPIADQNMAPKNGAEFPGLNRINILKTFLLLKKKNLISEELEKFCF
jgi:hypothetical protein